jgi:hypothetical protein
MFHKSSIAPLTHKAGGRRKNPSLRKNLSGGEGQQALPPMKRE